MTRILVLHGPNLNLLGLREPHIYGATTLDDINQSLQTLAVELSVEVQTFQSNHEGDLIDRLHAARQDGTRYIIINPAAYTHTSVAIRDAVAAIAIPVIEVHLTNTAARESFRRRSYLTPVAAGLVMGFGVKGYLLALEGLLEMTKEKG